MHDLSAAMRNTILALFWSLLALFLLTAYTMFSDDMAKQSLGAFIPEPFLFLMGMLIVVAGTLFIVTLWQPVEKTLKRFLLLTGGSIIALVFSIVLHNFLYALAEMTKDSRFLFAAFSALHAAFFLVGLLLFPLTFIAGVAGVIVILVRARTTPDDPSVDDPEPA